MNVFRLFRVQASLALILITLCAAAFAQSGQRGQGEHLRERLGKPPAFGLLLKNGVPVSLIGAGTLTTDNGGSTTTERSGTRSCALPDGGTTTLSANTPCVEALGLLVDGASELVHVSPVTITGTPYSFSGDYTPTTMDLAHNGDIIMMWTTGTDMVWGRLVSGDFAEFNCGAYDGAAEYDVYTTGHFTNGVTGHFSCSYDGTTLKGCLDGSCVSGAKTFTRTTSIFNNVYLMNDSFFTGLPVMPGHLAHLCADPSPTKCK